MEVVGDNANVIGVAQSGQSARRRGREVGGSNPLTAGYVSWGWRWVRSDGLQPS